MVVKLSHGRVKLGITAPQDVHVVRGELIDRDISGKGNCHGSDN
jgi:sRNA-binding carbon storage regulator CsrA